MKFYFSENVILPSFVPWWSMMFHDETAWLQFWVGKTQSPFISPVLMQEIVTLTEGYHSFRSSSWAACLNIHSLTHMS